MGDSPGKLTRRGLLKALWKVTLGYGVTGVVGYGYTGQIEPRWLAVERTSLSLKGLDSALSGFRLVCLSDFHLYPYIRPGFVRKAVRAVNRLAPDLVCLLGDYVLEGSGAILELAPVLAGLEAKYGVLAAMGNHDLWTNAQVVRAGLEESGIPVLVNEGIALRVGQGALYVAGLDDAWSGEPDLAAALADAPEGVPVVLMAHEPDFADEWSVDERVSLQLSGHSHGGQVRLPGLGIPMLPRYARRYPAGLYRVNGMWLYTTRGVGMVGPPERFNCRPEITEITLMGEPG